MSASNFHENLAGHTEVRTSGNRSFGLVIAAALAVTALLPLRHGGGVRLWALLTGGAFALCALLLPSALAPLNRAWTALGLLMGKIVSPVALTLLYYGVFTPMALLMKALGKDPLRCKASGSASYWIPRPAAKVSPASMRQQF